MKLNVTWIKAAQEMAQQWALFEDIPNLRLLSEQSNTCMVPCTRDLGSYGPSHTVLSEVHDSAVYVVPLPTPVSYYKSLAWSPLPRPCVGGCSKPLRTFHHAFLVPVLRAEQNGT